MLETTTQFTSEIVTEDATTLSDFVEGTTTGPEKGQHAMADLSRSPLWVVIPLCVAVIMMLSVLLVIRRRYKSSVQQGKLGFVSLLYSRH